MDRKMNRKEQISFLLVIFSVTLLLFSKHFISPDSFLTIAVICFLFAIILYCYLFYKKKGSNHTIKPKYLFSFILFALSLVGAAIYLTSVAVMSIKPTFYAMGISGLIMAVCYTAIYFSYKKFKALSDKEAPRPGHR